MVSLPRTQVTPRLLAALDVLRQRQVLRRGSLWLVESVEPGRYYRVDGHTCDCPDATYRNRQCKHVLAVELLSTPRLVCPCNQCPVDSALSGRCCHGCPGELECADACRSRGC